MTLAELRSIIQRRFRNRADAPFITAVNAAIKNAQIDLEQDTVLPKFLRTSAPLVLSANGISTALPSDFILQTAVWIGSVPAQIALSENILSADSDAIDSSLVYAIDGDSLLVYPPTDAVRAVTLYYYASQPALVNDSDTNKWSIKSPTLLYSLAGMKLCADYQYNDKTKADFQSEYSDGRRRLLALSAAQEDAD